MRLNSVALRTASSRPWRAEFVVSKGPGASPLTRTPLGPHSFDITTDIPHKADFVARYSAMFGQPIPIAGGTTLTMAACELRSRCGSAPLHRNTGPFTLTAYARSQSSGVSWATIEN